LNVARNELTWSDENHRIFGIPPNTPMSYLIIKLLQLHEES